ncbi:MAG: L-lactate permease [Trueperaceae bacterium]|nr:L-lactate permease [Trueperaceae bacterium]
MPLALQALLAGLPIVIILVLMLFFRFSAAKAGLIGLGATLLIAWFAFGYGTTRLPDLGVAVATGGALGEAVFIALTILWIIFPALCIHQLQLRTGQVDVLRLAMGRLSPDPRIVALLVAWFFVLFIEGAAGFGTSVALAAPFLVAAGFGRVEAVVIALIGHSVGVSFGAVGTPILPQIAVTPFGGLELAHAAAVYHALVGWLMPLIAMILVSRSLPSEQRQSRAIWGWTALAAVLFLVPFYLIARFIGPELPTLGGALVGGIAFVGVLSVVGRNKTVEALQTNEPQTDESQTDESQTDEPQPLTSAPQGPGLLVKAAAPYLVLVGLVLVTRLIPPLQDTLQNLTLGWEFDVFSGSIALLYHPGTMLMLGFLFGALWQQTSRKDVLGAMREAGGQLGAVSLALIAMLGLSRVMVYAGMIDSLAEAAAFAAGSSWPLFTPFVGVLGTFVTGSATASNILFTDFQQATANTLGLSPLPILGAQSFGAAVGNIICPHNIIAAGATVALTGQEGAVLARTLWPCLLYAALGGLLAFFVFT